MHNFFRNAGLHRSPWPWRSFPPQSRFFSNTKPRDFWSRRTLPKPRHDTFIIEELRRPSLMRPLLFTISVSGLSLVAAAQLTNWNTQKWIDILRDSNPIKYFFTLPSNKDMRRARQRSLSEQLQARYDELIDYVAEETQTVTKTAYLMMGVYFNAAQNWLDSGEGSRVCRMIMCLTTAVWLAWKIRRFRPFMSTHFMDYSLSGKSYTMLTSVFSHAALIHLLLNNVALGSFGPFAMRYLTESQEGYMPESTSMFHFLSFFITAGVFSSFLANAVRIRLFYPRLIKSLISPQSAAATTAAATSSATTGAAAAVSATAASAVASASRFPHSLGASGALYACVTMCCLAFPKAEAGLIFPADVTVPLPMATGAIILLDVVGVLRGWKRIDHLAHLSGAAFGVIYYYYGPVVWDTTRRVLAGVESETGNADTGHQLD
ncbi:hypothetical protein M422DRAFT_219751 [Sphaerobolus stellatus SS14]|nr:hypothetical protein M422DRAFT_219751 [Sphaerobolus stellatus SS14]